MSAGGILLVLEESRKHTPAMQRAFDLARRLRLPVHVLLEAFDPLIQRAQDEYAEEAERARQQLLRKSRRWLARLVEAWKSDGLRVSGEVLWSPTAHRTIVGQALVRKPAFVVKDCPPTTGARRLLYPVLGWKLVRYCPAPLLLVHPRSGHLPERILAAVDATAAPSGLGDAVTRAAGRLGEALGAEVHLAHAFVHPRPQYDFLGGVHGKILQSEAGQFDRFAGRHAIPPPYRHFLRGHAASTLVELVDALDIGLMVIGSAQRSALDRLFVGSTAAALARRMPCDLLILKPQGFRAAIARQFGAADT